MKKSIFLILIFVIAFVYVWAQNNKPVLYTNIKQIPSYLKLVKPFTNPKNNNLHKQLKPVNNKLTGKITTDITSPFPSGMNEENAIPARKFSIGTGGRIALLYSTTPSLPANEAHNVNVAVIPLRKPNGEYVYSTSVPIKWNELSPAILNASWKIIVGDEGSFYLSSASTGELIGVDAPSTGALPVAKMMPASEGFKTKLYLYRQGAGNRPKLFLYNPSYRVFIGRKMINARTVSLVAIKVSDYQARRIPQGVSFGWDFKTDRNFNPHGPNNILVSYLAYLSSLPVDVDGDGYSPVEYGGNDCDDSNPQIHPGKTEICDPLGVDEDCDPSTCGKMDRDHDGYIDIACYNIDPRTGVITSQGDDCNDQNPAIYPGMMYYISDKRIGVCGLGEFDVDDNHIAVYQPNGTAIVVPK